jgi:hypothetical protein
MRRWIGPCACAAACYSPHASPGAPCSPAAPNCPSSQWCALVAGAYQCVDGAVEDAAAIDAAIDAPHDARPIDASVDAPPPPWALVQTQESTTASITIGASGAGHLIVVGVETGTNGAVTSISDDAGNTYAQLVRAVSNLASPTFGAELWFAKDSRAGATRLAVSAPTVNSIVVWEAANISTANPLDTDTKLDNQATSTTPLGAAVTTSAPGELVIAVAIVDNSVTGLHTGSEFTNDRLTNGNGWAHITSTSAPASAHQAQWDQPSSGVSCAVSAAFRIGP